MIERNIHSPRGTVYYWTNERGFPQEPAIVFCHGLTADHTLFDRQVELLAVEFKLITWDFPLHGKSRPYKDFTYANVNEELSAILRQENIEKVVLVGQSAGGFIAQSFIAEHKNKVIGFIGIGTTPFGKIYYKKSELFWIKHYSAIAGLYPFSYYCKAAAKAAAKTEEARENMHHALTRLGRRGMMEAASAVYREFLKIEHEVPFRCPVLLTYGEYDNTGYVKKYNNRWAERTGLPLKIISDASHNANYDNFAEFNDLLISFVQSIK